jgi:predicted CoA-binding protein
MGASDSTNPLAGSSGRKACDRVDSALGPILKPILGALSTSSGRILKPNDHCVVVLGASPKPIRYSYQAVKLLAKHGYRVIPVHPKARRIDHLPVVNHLSQIVEPVHTLTLYLGPERSRSLIADIVGLAPGRVICNPGSESRELEAALDEAHIPHERACTLVLLRVGQF